MSTEVEIKFVVKPEVKSQLATLLADYVIIEQAVKPLSNTYFDTTTSQFRQFDFGLRTRKSLNFAEQTIKTAGIVRGGLHQRPEYNLPLPGDVPTLADFPAEIWPNGTNIAQLQADLVDLFTTDFERTMWHIKLANDAEIEVVFDQGMARSGEQSYPICEIELELVCGDISDLFTLAQQITQLGNVRLGNVSKAKRGYQLAGLYTPKIKPLTLKVPTVAGQELKTERLTDIFLATLTQSYAHWQHHEQQYLETQDISALAEVDAAVALILQTMQSYAPILPDIDLSKAELVWLQQQLSAVSCAAQLHEVMLKNGQFMRKLPEYKRIGKELEALQTRYIDFSDIETLFNSPRYASIMLSVSQLLSQGLTSVKLDTANVIPFANTLLQKSWQSVLDSLLSAPELTLADYLGLQAKLKQNLLIGHCFSHHYRAERRDKFRLPWQDILQGIDDLAILQVLMDVAQQQPPAITVQIEKLITRKQRALLDALEQTRLQALTMRPYWLED
ncbi:CYTH and CHAD domain-containing protein [Moritella marina ATCC 15381]|uniref:CYTH and CHAD domain-containing protein n=1 Tax=Moritella marina ATCC 15381 TaxID=1202962 RepID=A0A5J6WPI9_MORMI|nr:CYTH and CHAD domain-containing protein [Moritella marina]QFI39877.1 CYTH and CHAD domain-containing protein [Moritella marina ATCC 15381]